MDHIKDFLKELDLLKYFVCFVSERFIAEPQSQDDHIANFFTHVLAVAGHATMLFWLYLPELAPEEIHVMLSDFLRMSIKPTQSCIRKIYVDVLQSLKSTMLQSGWCPHINEHAQANFLEIVLHNLVELQTNSNSSQVVALKDHVVILQEMLNLWRANINSVSMQDLEFLQDIDYVIIDIGLLIYSLYNGEEDVKEAMALKEVNQALVLKDLMGKIQHTTNVTFLFIQKVFQSNLPRICGLGYVDFLLNNLKEFQNRPSYSLDSIMNQLQLVQKELESLHPFLEVAAEEKHSDHINKVMGQTHVVKHRLICSASVWQEFGKKPTKFGSKV